MTTYTEVQPTLENYWRSIILFGRNVASYKFALGKSLLELSQQGKETVTLEELAEPFSRHICRHSETDEELVVYRPDYGEQGLWVRPKEMFLETVEVDGKQVPRFEFLGEKDK